MFNITKTLHLRNSICEFFSIIYCYRSVSYVRFVIFVFILCEIIYKYLLIIILYGGVTNRTLLKIKFWVFRFHINLCVFISDIYWIICFKVLNIFTKTMYKIRKIKFQCNLTITIYIYKQKKWTYYTNITLIRN